MVRDEVSTDTNEVNPTHRTMPSWMRSEDDGTMSAPVASFRLCMSKAHNMQAMVRYNVWYAMLRPGQILPTVR